MLWIGTAGGGLTKLQAGIFTTFGALEGLTDLSIMAIAEDQFGDLVDRNRGAGSSGVCRRALSRHDQ